MIRAVLRWAGIVLAGLLGVFVLVAVAAAVTDRPSAEPLRIDRDAPAVAAFLAAEATLLAHHGLDHTEHVVTVDDPDLRVRVLEAGAGPPVVFLPGGTGEAARFAPLLAELDGYRFLLVNRPGGGASDGVDLRAVDHRELARATLDAVYDHFALDQAPVVASSVGGTWALWYGLDRPERVTATVQLGVPGAVEGTTAPVMLRMLGVPGLNRILAATVMPASAPEEAGDALDFVLGHPPELAEELPRAALEAEHAADQLPTFALTWRSLGQDTFRITRRWNPDVEISAADLARFDHPTLLVWPSDDPFGDVEAGREVAAHLPEATFEVAGIGHLPWLDDPPGVAALIDEFLGAHTTPDR